MSTIDAELRDLLAGMRELLDKASLPLVLTKKRAAEELSVSLSKLKQMVRSGEILTVVVGKVEMVPASEVRRLATPKMSRPTERAPDKPKRARTPRQRRTEALSEADAIRALTKQH